MATMELVQTQPVILEKPEAAGDVLAAQAKALVQARYQVAYARPRDWDEVRQRLLKDCQRTSFAESALYSKPVGGSSVQGLSIRFAEAALRAMTNLQVESVAIYDSPEKRIVRLSVTDFESNLPNSHDIVLEKRIERKQLKQGQVSLGERLNSKGQTVYLVEATEDDLATKQAAQTSKALRQLALRLLPGDIADECEVQIRNTLREHAKRDPDAAKKKLVDAFADLGVKVDELKSFLGVASLDGLAERELISLRQVYQAIKDGETNWRDVMEQREGTRGKKDDSVTGKGSETLAGKLKAQRKPEPSAIAQDQPTSS